VSLAYSRFAASVVLAEIVVLAIERHDILSTALVMAAFGQAIAEFHVRASTTGSQKR